ncbi:hypothetical protein OCGS_0347 [Oceaniovalibus guishaninsula JLT2003]|uniref:5-hydroxyisourate hydrolase n=1 Tax=Oceaniovalibus guishaninsula JLT2003 TaxID=1231392 RepID=K2HFJ6_9RHOB|nr:hydroxyisourate hydrolase [Oceaniovalibus guishaninsula]EKE45257.1 hypothetical protein OCGS_0347 [Oceaniovalibus guishaninsula JLT2003]
MLRILFATAAIATTAGMAKAEDISTHVLNISTGQGGSGIPVTLDMQRDGDWTQLGTGTTQDNGRVEGFGIDATSGLYRLTFDLSGYDALGDAPFFPQIAVMFDISDTDRHHHVPVLVSPYGYSTYLGN